MVLTASLPTLRAGRRIRLSATRCLLHAMTPDSAYEMGSRPSAPYILCRLTASARQPAVCCCRSATRDWESDLDCRWSGRVYSVEPSCPWKFASRRSPCSRLFPLSRRRERHPAPSRVRVTCLGVSHATLQLSGRCQFQFGVCVVPRRDSRQRTTRCLGCPALCKTQHVSSGLICANRTYLRR